jgi:transposase
MKGFCADALVGGTTDPEVLAELARGRLRSKLPALRDALEGCFSSHHALMVGKIVAPIDYLDESIGDLSVEIERGNAPLSRRRSNSSTPSRASIAERLRP